MLYQLSNVLLWPILGIDVVLVTALYFLPRHQRRKIRIVRYGVIILLALLTGFFKLLRTSPGLLASTPVHVTVASEHPNLLRSFYYITQYHRRTIATWKSYMPGKSSDAVLEGDNARLFLAMQRNDQWLITPIYNVPLTSEAVVDLDKARFLPDRTGVVEEAIGAYHKWEIGSYLSSFLTLALVVLLIQRLRYLGPGTTKASPTALLQPSIA